MGTIGAIGAIGAIDVHAPRIAPKPKSESDVASFFIQSFEFRSFMVIAFSR
jgi:hypothetical protein